jgi:regulator of replication initiation timing
MSKWQIPIYKAEKDAGIAKAIRASSSVSYASKLIPSDINKSRINKCFERLVSAAKPNFDKQIDLFYLDTILVTTSCNLNNDIFVGSEVWSARATPEDKPFNFGHNQSDIIGHITASYAVDEKYQLIDDEISTDELPEKFHLLTSAVIYKIHEDEKRQEWIDKIIAEIEDGKWFVSMEALFRNFDYGLISPTGESRIVARNEETAVLTKHLRQYGGTGKYNDYTIGRVLRNITFCGKGLVEDPANPESLILNNLEDFKGVASKTVYINLNGLDNVKTEITMAENAKNEAVTSLESKVASLETELSTAKSELDKKTKEVETLTSEKAGLKTKVDELTKEKAEANRKSFLVSKGFDETKALDIMKDLEVIASDEAFRSHVEKYIVPVKAETKVETTPEEVLTTAAKTEEAPIPNGAPEPESDKASASLEDTFKNIFKNK